MKTTNVKANAFKTPMPKTAGYDMQKTKIRSTSARKHKLKVHQPEVTVAEPAVLSEDDEEPEIEYCPPKITPMLDLPEMDFSLDHEFPEIDGQDCLAYAYESSRDRRDPTGPDGLRKSEREAQRKRKEWDEHTDKLLEEAARQTCTLTDADLEFWGVKPLESQVSTVKSTQPSGRTGKAARAPPAPGHKSSALPSSKSQPSFAAPTATARARKAAIVSSTSHDPGRRALTPGESASRTTVGYSTGRKVSSELRQQANTGRGITRKPITRVPTLNDMLEEFRLQQDLEECEDDEGMPFKRVDSEDIIIPGMEDYRDFRLEL